MKKVFLSLALLLCAAVQAAAQSLVDPCQSAAKTVTPISTASAITLLFSGAAARKNYLCSFAIVSPDAEKVSVIEGTGLNCATSPLTLIGGPTAASGMSLAANGVFALGNGASVVAAGNNQNFGVCLLQSGAGTVSGVATSVQQ